MKHQARTLKAMLLLAVTVAVLCVLSVSGADDALGIYFCGAIGYWVVVGQGERVLSVMNRAIRRSKPIVVVLPTFRPILQKSFQAIGLPITSTGLMAALASPPNAPPFIRSI